MSGRKTLPPRVSNMRARRQPQILMFVGSSPWIGSRTSSKIIHYLLTSGWWASVDTLLNYSSNRHCSKFFRLKYRLFLSYLTELTDCSSQLSQHPIIVRFTCHTWRPYFTELSPGWGSGRGHSSCCLVWTLHEMRTSTQQIRRNYCIFFRAFIVYLSTELYWVVCAMYQTSLGK